MTPEEIDHVRADVQQAILEAQQHDPVVTLEILWRLFDQVASLAQAEPGSEGWRYPSVGYWAESVLRDVQLRGVSKVPYGEPQEIEPHDPWEPR